MDKCHGEKCAVQTVATITEDTLLVEMIFAIAMKKLSECEKGYRRWIAPTMKPKQTKRSSTYALANGGFLHIDRQIMPLAKPKKKPKL